MQRKNHDEFDTLHWVVVIGAIALVIAGLIEFNARRQASAMMQELMRPMTAQEKAQMDAQAAAAMRELEAQFAPAAQPRTRRAPSRRTYDPRPLADNETCADHVRIRREGSAWTEVGTCQ